MKKYKAVSGPKHINVDKGGVQSGLDVFAEIINKEAANGWEYHSMETLSITEKPGCFQAAIPINHYMLIFVRES